MKGFTSMGFFLAFSGWLGFTARLVFVSGRKERLGWESMRIKIRETSKIFWRFLGFRKTVWRFFLKSSSWCSGRLR